MQVRAIEGHYLDDDRTPPVLPFADARLNAPLPGGGLSLGALHEFTANALEAELAPSVTGFAATVLAAHLRARGGVALWAASQTDFYAPGLRRFGLDPARVVFVDCRKDAEVLAVMEEALHSRAVAAVLGEAGALTLKTGRRLDAAARASNALALLIRRHVVKPGGVTGEPSGAASPAGASPPSLRPMSSAVSARRAGASTSTIAAMEEPHPLSWRHSMAQTGTALTRATGKRAMYVWLPNFAMTLARLKRPRLAKRREPLALLEKHGTVRRIAALDGPAIEAGLYLHQPLADALAVCPKLVTADADPAAEADARAALALWAQRYTPATAPAPSGLWLDITGCAHLVGDEDELADDLLGRLEARGIPARAAIAPTFGAAFALAHHAERYVIAGDFAAAGGAPSPLSQQATLFESEEDRRVEAGLAALLAPLPVERLRIVPETASVLRKLGLYTIGDVLPLPRASLARRFPDLLPQLDKALGRADEAIDFLREPTPWLERLRFAEPLAAPEDIERVTRALLDMLCRRLERERHGGLTFEVSFFRADGGVEGQTVTTALPCRDPARVMRLFREKLPLIDPGFGIDSAMIFASRVEPLEARQSNILRKVQGEASLEDLAALIDGIENRFGEGRVYRFAPRESHMPERAVARIPALADAAAAFAVAETPRLAAQEKEAAPFALCEAPRGAMPELRSSNAGSQDYSGASLSAQTGEAIAATRALACAGKKPSAHAARGGETPSHQTGEISPSGGKVGPKSRRAPKQPAAEPSPWELLPERPVRLFTRPHPIDVTAALPDAPPMLFRWRKVVHRIVRADGPERIASEWWRALHDEDREVRDYYRVESAHGMRFWVYREGEYGGERPPRWYLHGVFA
ncbi:protein imuB [Rhodomicrobium udaipurense JA643]|nr:hypothetical protein [Rhodomicrobium udaipurense]KAI94132.1 protein imuB [Rhodomicrobium udaipurense JA643]